MIEANLHDDTRLLIRICGAQCIVQYARHFRCNATIFERGHRPLVEVTHAPIFIAHLEGVNLCMAVFAFHHVRSESSERAFVYFGKTVAQGVCFQ